MKIGKKSRKNRVLPRFPNFRQIFSDFHSGTFFEAYLFSYFGPKGRGNLFSSRLSESQYWSFRYSVGIPSKQTLHIQDFQSQFL